MDFISPESFLIFFLNLYIWPWLQKIFKFRVLRLLQIHLWVKKLNLLNFTHALKQHSPPGFYHYPPGRYKFPIPPKQHFLKIFFPEQKEGWWWGGDGEGGEDDVFEKITKINKGIGVLVTIFDKFYRLCNLYSFTLSFLVQ